MRTILLAVAFAAAACGGSSSETPFPPRPNATPLGPAGETERGRVAPLEDAGPGPGIGAPKAERSGDDPSDRPAR